MSRSNLQRFGVTLAEGESNDITIFRRELNQILIGPLLCRRLDDPLSNIRNPWIRAATEGLSRKPGK